MPDTLHTVHDVVPTSLRQNSNYIQVSNTEELVEGTGGDSGGTGGLWVDTLHTVHDVVPTSLRQNSNYIQVSNTEELGDTEHQN